MLKHIFLLGPEGSGKTLMQKTLAVTFGDEVWPINIDIKSARTEDFMIVSQRLYRRGLEASKKIFSWDGAFRTATQADKLLTELVNVQDCLSCAVVLTASETVCYRRLISRNEDRIGADNAPNASFSDNFRQYQADLIDIIRIFLSKGIEVHDVNTTSISPSDTATRVASIVRTFLSRTTGSASADKSHISSDARARVQRTTMRISLINRIHENLQLH